MPFCSRCGRELAYDARFCTYCGAAVSARITAPRLQPSSSIKTSHLKRNITVICIPLLLIGVTAAWFLMPGRQPEPAEKQTTIQESRIVIVHYEVNIGHVHVDKVQIDSITLLLRNEGPATATITRLAIVSHDESLEITARTTVNPGDTREVAFGYVPGELSKDFGVTEIATTMTLFGHSGNAEDQVLAERVVVIPIPRVRIGDTIPDLDWDLHNLSLTFLWWKESAIAVDGPYVSGYYTFTARPSMKFIILAYKFQNNWIREQTTPYFHEGEIAADNGYIYSVWDPPGGVHAEEYAPRPATSEEVRDLIGDSGGFEKLLPEESVEGCVVFELPADARPIEASVIGVFPLIEYDGSTYYQRSEMRLEGSPRPTTQPSLALSEFTLVVQMVAASEVSGLWIGAAAGAQTVRHHALRLNNLITARMISHRPTLT